MAAMLTGVLYGMAAILPIWLGEAVTVDPSPTPILMT